MNHPWQQPIRPLEVHPHKNTGDFWYPVIFIRPCNDRGWEVITRTGINWSHENALIRERA